MNKWRELVILTIEPLSAHHRPRGFARQHQLRGVREDDHERVGGGRVTSIAPKVTKAIRRTNPHSSQVTNNQIHAFGKLTYSSLFLIVRPQLLIEENIFLEKLKVMYLCHWWLHAAFVWIRATLLNKISKTWGLWLQFRFFNLRSVVCTPCGIRSVHEVLFMFLDIFLQFFPCLAAE